ncbi:hypothetical protein LTR62_007320 [Meristemomyces frigidus]|uniref:Uncharacterized protein n=1 Tax=Meristemomyces frigidus TaxID=1508187 RepID=A0AAN7YRG6_9PEZI|nr:hypothetical protein LTR62_007320 [Meristemomyces frigidus]
MDAEALQMMADLGLARRDMISAPEADAKGRPMRGNTSLNLQAASDFEARKERIRNNAPKPTELSNILSKWNTTELFERDEIAEQLENRFSGQGHRAALNAAFVEGQLERWDAGTINDEGSYTSKTPAPSTTRPQRPRPVNFNNSPRPFSALLKNNNFADRGRIGPPQQPNRAPSPRTAGRVRFVHGKRVAVTSASTFPRVRGPTPTAPAAMRATSNTTARNRHFLPTAPALSKQPALTMNEENNQQAARNRALWHISHPGADCDRYLLNKPEELDLYHKTLVAVIKEVFNLAINNDESENATYIADNKDREWMVKEAYQAKAWVENNQLMEMDAYYVQHPERNVFSKAARANFKPLATAKQSSNVVTTTAIPVTTGESNKSMKPIETLKITPAPLTPAITPTSSTSVPSTTPATASKAISSHKRFPQVAISTAVSPLTTEASKVDGVREPLGVSTPVVDDVLVSTANGSTDKVTKVAALAISPPSTVEASTERKDSVASEPRGAVKPTTNDTTNTAEKTTASSTTHRVHPGTFPGDHTAENIKENMSPMAATDSAILSGLSHVTTLCFDKLGRVLELFSFLSPPEGDIRYHDFIAKARELQKYSDTGAGLTRAATTTAHGMTGVVYSRENNRVDREDVAELRGREGANCVPFALQRDVELDGGDEEL